MAIINLNEGLQEEITYDLNVQLFNVLPRWLAQRYWAILETYIDGGIQEDAAYTYVNGWIKEYLDSEQNKLSE